MFYAKNVPGWERAVRVIAGLSMIAAGLLYFQGSMLGYGLAAALIMSLALGICVKVWNWLTPVDEWEELKKGNIAVAMVLAAVIIGFAIVVSTAISPGH